MPEYPPPTDKLRQKYSRAQSMSLMNERPPPCLSRISRGSSDISMSFNIPARVVFQKTFLHFEGCSMDEDADEVAALDTRAEPISVNHRTARPGSVSTLQSCSSIVSSSRGRRCRSDSCPATVRCEDINTSDICLLPEAKAITGGPYATAEFESPNTTQISGEHDAGAAYMSGGMELCYDGYNGYFEAGFYPLPSPPFPGFEDGTFEHVPFEQGPAFPVSSMSITVPEYEPHAMDSYPHGLMASQLNETFLHQGYQESQAMCEPCVSPPSASTMYTPNENDRDGGERYDFHLDSRPANRKWYHIPEDWASHTVFISGFYSAVDGKMKEQIIKDHYADFTIEKIDTPPGRGFCFVVFSTVAEAQAALKGTAPYYPEKQLHLTVEEYKVGGVPQTSWNNHSGVAGSGAGSGGGKGKGKGSSSPYYRGLSYGYGYYGHGHGTWYKGKGSRYSNYYGSQRGYAAASRSEGASHSWKAQKHDGNSAYHSRGQAASRAFGHRG